MSPPDAFDRTTIRVVFPALLLVMLLAALDQTIVSTALPTIVGELGGLENLSWVVTAYLLSSTIVVPLYGKLGDLFGRRRVLEVAIGLFLLGSVLCGLAQNMTQLVLLRALQGLGGGGLMVTTMAAIGDVIPPAQRGRYQGVFGGVFGLATILGPLLGGAIVQHWSWRWIFYINVPLGILALVAIGAAFKPRPTQLTPKIDYLGAAFLAGALVCLTLFTSEGGSLLPWTSVALWLMLLLGVACVGGFIYQETRAAEPLLPLLLFRQRTFALSSAISFIVGFAMFGAVTFLPLYLQVVKGSSPTRAGLQMLPMMAGMLVTSIVSGRIISHTGRYRLFPIAGMAIAGLGMMLLARLRIDTGLPVMYLYMALLGLGLGMVMQVLILAVQNDAPFEYLGVVTSGVTLFRSIGGSFGVAAFGAVFSSGLHARLLALLPPDAKLPRTLDPHAIQTLPTALRDDYLSAFSGALHGVYTLAASIIVIAFVLACFMREAPLRTQLDKKAG